MKIICDGCNKELQYEGQTHEILHNQFDRFPELCGHGIVIEEEDLAQPQDSADPCIDDTCICGNKDCRLTTCPDYTIDG